jgi:F-type H+-transporting ATPase subunit delta
VRDETVAHSYAETLFELGLRHEGVEVYAEGIDQVATLLDGDPRFRLFLETPRIDAASKKRVVRKAFAGALPEHLLNFLLITIDKRRQRLLRRIAHEFRSLMDEHLNRVHVEVSVARPMDDATLERVRARLSLVLGKEAVPRVRVTPELLGGVVVRTGDTIYDGSLRRRLDRMRRRLLAADIPTAPAAGGA